MSIVTSPPPTSALERLRPSAWLRAVLLRHLGRVDQGRLTIETPSGERIHVFGREDGPEATVVIKRWRGIWRLFRGGDVGFAEAYMDGDVASPDLTALLMWATKNEAALASAMEGSRLAKWTGRALHVLNENTRRGSRRNIAAHYDLGNKFYEGWLDPSMTYSSAMYQSPTQSLEDAQANKIAHAIELLEVQPHDKVLEIGIGWGAMARALLAKDATLTGVTLSTEQLALASDRVRAEGDKAQLRLQDYRDVDGLFDKIVSIEMIEAVGENYWPTFFRTVRERLKPHGIAVLQAITIEVSRFAAYRQRPDFIQRYIFPGGMLLTVDAIRREAERAGLALVKADMFGESYARTLAEWQQRFQRAWPSIQALGFDLRFKRMWEYYLAYCETGFRLGTLDVGQYKLVAR
ncbi:cyclopropane-fatty-acyl-phospholipid synthase [Variibacter gotjawalensis]|uniref:Cyclopropane-fatty-acyl-phospholipid synthase n=1 Tax=Variibacter gotjawalensis TaxID=1333996 RepID=A0A0S3PZR8_9BRAD|nr:cyclopropane-fatty-acyl-phospholipid synthase family protein [Variibacter gotjawalensis]NIK47243.1 cyclopropane-fatty-acyl-phospholipid synthase [Variibacter gotjawalensis]RZS49144.1 cyclopropane-fatty-acyl-phospholipid synthase [Variibacter gotjawalensis]BAT61405.1 cyclopropane-fatty-acyl-phospholipid synthase [Variibacter gotjawalensis]